MPSHAVRSRLPCWLRSAALTCCGQACIGVRFHVLEEFKNNFSETFDRVNIDDTTWCHLSWLKYVWLILLNCWIVDYLIYPYLMSLCSDLFISMASCQSVTVAIRMIFYKHPRKQTLDYKLSRNQYAPFTLAEYTFYLFLSKATRNKCIQQWTYIPKKSITVWWKMVRVSAVLMSMVSSFSVVESGQQTPCT